MRRRLCVVAWLSLLLARVALAAPALVASPGPDPVLLAKPAAEARPGLWIRPYLQAVGAETATLRFETVLPQAVKVTLSVGDAAAPVCSLDDTKLRVHEVKAMGLTPETAYVFRVSASGEAPGEARVTTWPAAPKTVRFFVYGDTRTRPAEHKKVCDAMARKAAGHLFVLHSGDLVARGRSYPLWKTEFFDPAADLLARLPVCPVPGNHEEASELYRAYFTLPATEWYWSLRCGPVYVLGLDSQRGLDSKSWLTSEQGQWLRDEMPKADTPWRLALLHTPLYSLGNHGALKPETGEPKEAAMAWARKEFQELLRKHGFQLTLSGHDHLYERSVREGLTMVTSGGGGAPLYSAGPPAQNPHSVKLVSKTHYMDITATDTTLEATVYDAEDHEIDSFKLTR